MFVLGLVLALVGYFFVNSLVLTIIGVALMVLGLFGNGYAHFGTPAGSRRRYWY